MSIEYDEINEESVKALTDEELMSLIDDCKYSISILEEEIARRKEK